MGSDIHSQFQRVFSDVMSSVQHRENGPHSMFHYGPSLLVFPVSIEFCWDISVIHIISQKINYFYSLKLLNMSCILPTS